MIRLLSKLDIPCELSITRDKTLTLDKAEFLESICNAIGRGELENARNSLCESYPFIPIKKIPHKYTEADAIKVFMRDGFIDRYCGRKLLFPPVLRILSMKFPNEFPFQKNWKMQETHVAYWELFPTVDHIDPVARGGKDEIENWATTSQQMNSAKSNWTLEEMGWHLHERGNITDWDGLLGWFIEFVENEGRLLESQYIHRWYKAANSVQEN